MRISSSTTYGSFRRHKTYTTFDRKGNSTMTRINSTQFELIPVATCKAIGLHLEPETSASRYGYTDGCDLWECLWYELCNSLRFGADWRKPESRIDRRLRELNAA